MFGLGLPFAPPPPGAVTVTRMLPLVQPPLGVAKFWNVVLAVPTRAEVSAAVLQLEYATATTGMLTSWHCCVLLLWSLKLHVPVTRTLSPTTTLRIVLPLAVSLPCVIVNCRQVVEPQPTPPARAVGLNVLPWLTLVVTSELEASVHVLASFDTTRLATMVPVAVPLTVPEAL